MRVVVQRVAWGRVYVQGRLVAQIERGFVVLLGVGHVDGEEQIQYLARHALMNWAR